MMFMSEEFATYQADEREVGSTESQATTKDVDDGFRVQNVTSSSSCRYQDNAGCSVYSRALAPFVTDAICLPTVLEFLYGLSPSVWNDDALYGLSPSVRNDDAQLSSYCKGIVRTMCHYHGGCVMGKVVDTDYRVLRTNALRVIDGSTFVNSPGTNPQVTVMMFGRYVHASVQIPCICLGFVA
jgi:choline dehydrogenase-like flavoprotein